MLHSCKCLQLNMRKWKRNVKESPSFYIAFLIKPWWKHSLLYKFLLPHSRDPRSIILFSLNNVHMLPETTALLCQQLHMQKNPLWVWRGIFTLGELRLPSTFFVILGKGENTMIQDFRIVTGIGGWITLSSAQGLYLALCRGLTPGKAWGTICVVLGIKPGSAICRQHLNLCPIQPRIRMNI